MQQPCDVRGFEENGVAGSVLEEDEDFAEEGGLFEEEGREVFLQNFKRVDKKVRLKKLLREMEDGKGERT